MLPLARKTETSAWTEALRLYLATILQGVLGEAAFGEEPGAGRDDPRAHQVVAADLVDGGQGPTHVPSYRDAVIDDNKFLLAS